MLCRSWGVKTVNAIYVGAGGVKQVWPAYTVGSQLLSFPSSSYWTGYRRCYNGGLDSGYSEYCNIFSSYMTVYIYYIRSNNVGCFICTKETVNANGLQYIGIQSGLQDTCSLSTHYDVYCSIASSQSSIISSDSGVGSYSYVTNTTVSKARDAFLIDLTSCTRTGYFKFGYVVSGNINAYEDNGTFYVYGCKVGDSTDFSSYGYTNPTSGNTVSSATTIKVT